MKSERTWQLSRTWRAKFLGFGSAWWLLLAPWLGDWLHGAALGAASREVAGALNLSHPALAACVLIAMCLCVGEPGSAQDWGKWFLIGVLLMPACGVLWFVFFSGFHYC